MLPARRLLATVGIAHDLGADLHAIHVDKDRKTRNLVHQLQALGHRVTLTPAA